LYKKHKETVNWTNRLKSKQKKKKWKDTLYTKKNGGWRQGGYSSRRRKIAEGGGGGGRALSKGLITKGTEIVDGKKGQAKIGNGPMSTGERQRKDSTQG